MDNIIEKPYETVIRAVAHYFQIPQDELLKGRSKKTTDTYRRYICFYLIRENNNKITWDFLSEKFNQTRSCIQYGYNRITNEMEIYRQTLNDVRTIQLLIDKFNQLKKEQLLSD